MAPWTLYWIIVFFCGAPSLAGQLFVEINPNFTATNFQFIDNTGAFLSSPNDTFRAALYNPSAQQRRFYLCVLHVSSNAIIWAANRDSPVSSSGRLAVTAGGIVISHENGTRAWSTPPLQYAAAAMRLTEDGNLVLLGDMNRPIWEAFNHPTDTMVSGQKARVGTTLTSPVAASDLAQGEYSLSVTADDAVLRWRSRLRYWSLSKDVRSFKDTNADVSYLQLNQSGLYLADGDGKLIAWRVTLVRSDDFRVAVLGSDGRFVVRRFSGGGWKEEFRAPDDTCRLPLVCGRLGLCSSSACTCPSGLRLQSSSGGCLPTDGSELSSCSNTDSATPVSYMQLQMGLNYFAIAFQDPISQASNLSACENSCSGNCSCSGFFFDNSSGTCYLLQDDLGSLFLDEAQNSRAQGFVKIVPRSNTGRAHGRSGRKKIPVAVLVLLPSFCAFILFVVMSVLIVRRRRGTGLRTQHSKLVRRSSSSSADMDQINIPGMPKRFKYEELVLATDNFSSPIGAGGFGVVYKGKLPDNSLVAVKKIGDLGVQVRKEFLTEIAIIGSIRHANLVKLRGFCAQRKQKLLVYEYMNRGSLDRALFGAGPVLEWRERVEIAMATARGLAYLHGGCEHKIIHCDIKPENILLHDFQVKISDFGLSKLLGPEQSALFTTMRGTRGYLAPEWLTNAAITHKTDVYSYGMVVLELIRGRKNSSIEGDSQSTRDFSSGAGAGECSGAGSGDGDGNSLNFSSGCYFPLLALEMHEQGRYGELADPRLEGRVTSAEVEKLVRVALCCVQEDPALRPTMATVVGMLEGGVRLCNPGNESLHFLRFYGRRFGPVGAAGESALLRRQLALASSTHSMAAGSPIAPSYLSSQQISGPR